VDHIMLINFLRGLFLSFTIQKLFGRQSAPIRCQGLFVSRAVNDNRRHK